MDETPATRCTLIFKLRDRADTEAWSEFVELYEPLVYRLARRRGLQDADARDLAQEVFRAVAQSVDRWDPARGGFRPWLARIARNLLINFLTRQREPRASGATSMQDLLEACPAADPAATALFEAEYRRHLFERAADDVRKDVAIATWHAFWQTAVEGRPPVDVAAELHATVGAVYVARSRVLARIKRRVNELSGDDAIIHEADNENSVGPL
jgi:RNA polymerase sigma-70 factor (ECF subfamily)